MPDDLELKVLNSFTGEACWGINSLPLGQRGRYELVALRNEHLAALCRDAAVRWLLAKGLYLTWPVPFRTSFALVGLGIDGPTRFIKCDRHGNDVTAHYERSLYAAVDAVPTTEGK